MVSKQIPQLLRLGCRLYVWQTSYTFSMYRDMRRAIREERVRIKQTVQVRGLERTTFPVCVCVSPSFANLGLDRRLLFRYGNAPSRIHLPGMQLPVYRMHSGANRQVCRGGGDTQGTTKTRNKPGRDWFEAQSTDMFSSVHLTGN